MEKSLEATGAGETLRDPILELQPTEVSLEAAVRSPLLKKQMPGLDILRGIAVLSVYFYHAFCCFLPSNPPTTHVVGVLQAITSGGRAGVSLFFVLSGFLITGILLDTRERANYWSSFYVRRFLRILPVYLVVLVAATIYYHLHWSYLVMCLLYAANMDYYFNNIGPTYGPLWSLAVEEQFYLVWPLMVRRLSRVGLTVLCCGIIIVCPVLRGLSVTRFPWLGDTTTIWQSADCLAWGALVAISLRSRQATLKRVRMACVLLGLLWILPLWALHSLHLPSAMTAVDTEFRYIAKLAFCTLLLMAALFFGGNRWVLRLSAPIRFFGYISYGFYLFHRMVLDAYIDIVVAVRGPLTVITAGFSLLRCVVVLVCCTAISYLSRRYFEERFLELKERLVPYTGLKHKR